MSYYDHLANAQEEIYKCMKCGNCQAVCPIYSDERTEAGVARGKVQLAGALLNGELEYNEKVASKFALCLTCKACVANCPCGVQVDKIIMAARAAIVQEKGLPWIKKVIFSTLKRQGVFDLGMRTGSIFQGMIMKKVPGKDQYNPRFPVGLDMRRIIPAMAKVSLRDELPEVNSPDTEKRARVAYFTGCMENYIYPDIGRSVVNVLKHNGIEVVIPKNQHCCGIPVFVHGDLPTAKEMARSHVEIFSKVDCDAIIVACSTGVCAFKHHYVELLSDEPEYLEKAKKLSQKTFEISEYLVDVSGYKKPKKEIKTTVTYHDPCHLARGHVVTRQPREIIKSIPGVKLIEMKKPDRCCGSAGSFSLTHYDLSMEINNKKITDIKNTKADQVITSCPACRMQITDGLEQNSLSMSVLHTVQLLDMAYRK